MQTLVQQVCNGTWDSAFLRRSQVTQCWWSSDRGVKILDHNFHNSINFSKGVWGSCTQGQRGRWKVIPLTLPITQPPGKAATEMQWRRDGKELPSRAPGWTAMIREPSQGTATSQHHLGLIKKKRKEKKLVGLWTSLSTLTGNIDNITN